MVWATVRQEVLPEMGARTEVARTRAEARRAFFEGKGSLGAAFPRLERASLGSAAVLRGRLAQLDDVAVERAREGAGPSPIGLTGRRLETWRSALEGALQARGHLR